MSQNSTDWMKATTVVSPLFTASCTQFCLPTKMLHVWKGANEGPEVSVKFQTLIVFEN